MKIIRHLKNLWGNERFRGSLVHFGVFATALSLFGYLTTADIITRKPEYVLPAPYQVLIQQSKVTSAVALEQALRSKDKDLQGLVFFKETKSVIVLKDGLENERLVVQADTE